MRVIQLFPPNWSACVNGPHLALPLLAGGAREVNEADISIWDLSLEYYRWIVSPPKTATILQSAMRNDYSEMDNIYFKWEAALSIPCCDEDKFGILSGYAFGDLKPLSLKDIVLHLKSGLKTVYSTYFYKIVLPKLVLDKPQIIGVTLASSNQIIPTVELVIRLREHLPGTFLLLGGNIVTRLYNTPAFHALKSLVDQIVLYQGVNGG